VFRHCAAPRAVRDLGPKSRANGVDPAGKETIPRPAVMRADCPRARWLQSTADLRAVGVLRIPALGFMSCESARPGSNLPLGPSHRAQDPHAARPPDRGDTPRAETCFRTRARRARFRLSRPHRTPPSTLLARDAPRRTGPAVSEAPVPRSRRASDGSPERSPRLRLALRAPCRMAPRGEPPPRGRRRPPPTEVIGLESRSASEHAAAPREMLTRLD